MQGSIQKWMTIEHENNKQLLDVDHAEMQKNTKIHLTVAQEERKQESQLLNWQGACLKLQTEFPKILHFSFSTNWIS